MGTILKIAYCIFAIFNGVTLTAIVFFGFQPSPHQIAVAAFFAAGSASIALFGQT